MCPYSNTSYFFQNTIWSDLLSYVVTKVELVCKLPKIQYVNQILVSFISFVTDCLYKLRDNDQEAKKLVGFSPKWVDKLRHQPD